MREILFRGKRTDNGEWVEGYLFRYKDSAICITREETDCIPEYWVFPATVGQFTGLTDKNGKKIFEGDILKHYCEHKADGIISIGVVFWDEKRCMFLRTSSGNETPQIWAGCEYEVIGNIHDNDLGDFNGN